MADFADTLPHDLDRGPGADPDGAPVRADGGASDGSGTACPGRLALAHGAGRRGPRGRRAALTGGSWQVSMAPTMTGDDSTLLISEPQLGYDPTLLVEFQITGAGYDARGVGVPRPSLSSGSATPARSRGR